MEIREALEKASAGETPSIPEPEAEVVETAPEPVAEVEQVEAAPAEETPAARSRDDKGRFAAKQEKVPEKPAATPKGGANGAAQAAPPAGQGKGDGAATPTVPSPQPASPAVKAPQSWKPSAREEWGKVPPSVQQEVARRESEIARTLQETAQARHTAEAVQRTLAPFAGLARANGMDEMQYAGSVLQTAAALQMGTPQQRAGVIATLIASYGVDVDAINAAMTGQAQRPSPQQPQQDVSALVQQEFNRRVAEAQQTKASQDWQSFVESSPEFLDDVKDDMRDILERAGQQGRNMTYQQAYDRACKLNDEVSSILAQRKAAEAARTPSPVTEAARRAASSIRSTPAAPMGAQPKGVGEALRAAAEKHGMKFE